MAGEVRLPGDKSISHRAALIGAVAEGSTRITNFASSADCTSTLRCIEALGAPVRRDGSSVIVSGSGKCGLRKPSQALDCGNSGTTMRLLSGILAGQPFATVLTGDQSLSERPMRRVIEPLTKMGAVVESRDGRAPLTMIGGRLSGIRFEPPVASAQIKSCVLLAGLFAEGRTTVVESTPTRDHTERMLREFNVEVDIVGSGSLREITVSGSAAPQATDITVPSDISSAAFFMIAAGCLPGSQLSLPAVGANPTRSAIISVVREFGLQVDITNCREVSREPVADLLVRGGIRGGAAGENVISGKIIANLIDELPILAVLGTQLDSGLEVRDASELRVKESDRIKSIVTNLRAMKADIEERDDGFRVGRSNLKGARIDSFGDHRIAMAFAVAGLLADGETEIARAECADVSFPGFFERLSEVRAA